MERLQRLRPILRHPFVVVPPLFYLFTMCRSLGFGDTAIMIDAMRRGLVDSQVNTHAMTVIVGMLFQHLPFGEYAVRANMVSVFFGSLTIITFYFVIFAEYESRVVAAIAATFMMMVQSMWWHSTMVENYGASAFFTTICLFLWHKFDRTRKESWLYWLCFAAGLSVFNHVQLGFMCTGVAVTGIMHAWPKGKAGLKIVMNCFLAALAGLIPWMAIILHDWAQNGNFALTIKLAFVGSFASTFFSGAFGPSIYDTSYLFWFNNPTPYLACGFIGIWLTWKRDGLKNPVTNGHLVAFLMNTINFCFYPTWDKYAFLLFSFVIFNFYSARGLNWVYGLVTSRSREWTYGFAALTAISFAIPPYLYNHVATWALDPDSVWHARYSNAYSENLYFQSEYIANPNKRNFRDVENFADMLFEKLPPDAVYVDDDSRSYYCIADYYQRYYKKRPDISTVLVNSWGISNWGMGGDALSELMSRAYYLNKPFFIASQNWPFNSFIKNARQRTPVEFEKFPLAGDKYIYRLITSAEKKDTEGWAKLEERGGYLPLVISAPAGFFDLTVKHVLFFSSGEPMMQDMRRFPDTWQGGDQLFFSSEKVGSVLEFGIKSEKAQAVALTFSLTTAPDYGIVNIEIPPDGPKKTVDLYNGHVQPMKTELPPFELKPGMNMVRLTVVDKNARSTNYRMGIDGFAYRLIPSEAAPRLPAKK